MLKNTHLVPTSGARIGSAVFLPSQTFIAVLVQFHLELAQMKPVFTPLEILGIADQEVGTPRNDGTPGCGLYRVPVRLSAHAPREWAEIFVHAFDHPSAYTSMHRPGICRVTGDRIILDGTTIDEIDRYHKATLKLALEVANRDYQAWQARTEADALRSQRARDEERAEIQRKAKRVVF